VKGENDMTKSGARLKELRKKKRETITDVATAVGVTPSAISMYEMGKRVPNDETKIALAKHFNRTVQYIFFSE
jgi:DNA-binding XRE family transcriptional regulator